MPQKSKKAKKKDCAKHKLNNAADKGDKCRNPGKGLNSKGSENLATHFNNEELQEIRAVLKNKDLTNVPLVIAAVILNKFDLLKKLVQKGYNVNETGPNHTTALMWAIKCKNVTLVDFLLSNGADSTAKNDNGDNVLFLALENRLWDEQSYIALWNHVKNIAFVDVDFIRKNGRNMLHTAIRREWNEFLNILILEKANVNVGNSNGVTPLMLASYINNFSMVDLLLQANANVLKEDTNGCTALCYAISSVINKNAQVPHLVVDRLMKALRSSGTTLKDYFKFQKRIDVILSDPVKQNKSGQILPDTKTCIIPYFLRYTDGTLKALLEVNIFEKMTQAMKKHFGEPHQIMKFLTITNELLKYCECCFGVAEKQLLETFMMNGGADMCLSVLKTYGGDSDHNYDFSSSAFAPLVPVCISQAEGRSWLYNNYRDILPFYTKFLTASSCEDSSDLQAKRNNDKMAKFAELINKIKTEKALCERDTCNSDDNAKTELQEDPKNLSQQVKEVQKISDRCVRDVKQEPKSNAKKTKRRAKALKAKIAKIKSADLTERLNQNGKKLLEQKCASDTSIVKKVVKSKKTEAGDGSDKNDNRSKQWTQHSAWEQIWLLDSGNHSEINEFNETLVLLENQIGSDHTDDIFNTNIEPQLESKNKQAVLKREVVSLYPDWKTKNSPLATPTARVFTCCSPLSNTEDGDMWSKSSEPPDDIEESSAKSKPTQEEINKLINYTLNYLSGLLRRIIITYQNHWDCDKEQECCFKNDHGDVKNNHQEKTSNLRSIIEKLEIEHTERVQAEFDKLTKYIKNSANNHLAECSKVIDKLESILLNHKIRGKSIIQDTPMQVVDVKHDFDNNFCSHYEMDQEMSVSKYIESILQRSKPLDSLEEDIINYPTGESDIVLSAHPDALYLQEVLALPPRQPPDPIKVRYDKIRTMKSAYHLIPSIMSVCDEDDAIIANQQERVKRERIFSNTSTSKYRKRQTLHETLLAMPKVEDPNKLLETLEKTQNISEYKLPFENMPSRWCNVVRSLQMANNYQILLNGDIRISCKEIEDQHTISSGGNFSPVVLGLDANDRPLAVKRIHKDNAVSKVMKNLLNPLLGLRNINLLHYFACNYEENDLILATPLCEYNMGEYVMMMKQAPNMYMRSIDIVKQFLAGVRFLHDRMDPIIHGNLKPSNIFIDLNGTVRIAEFGMHKALYTLIEAPNTSIIWFSRETFNAFKESSSLTCTCASDIQVAGMLIHFMLTAGKHPYGESMHDILKNLERAIPQLITTDVDLHDLISWMLLYEPSERPSINQVLSHVFFWTIERKWRFILACAGIGLHGTPLNIPLNELHLYINMIATKENIKGSWINITKRRFPNLTYSKEDQDSITGFLRFIRTCIQNQVTLHISGDYEFRNFILSSFPALPLSLYRILESSQWLNHRVLQPFTTVDSLFA